MLTSPTPMNSFLYILLEYAVLIIVILLVEKALAALMAFGLKKVLGLKVNCFGWLLMVVLSPYIHHLSHFIPVVGHLLTTGLLVWGKGQVYRKKKTDKPSGIGIGFVLFLSRIIFHYIVVVLGLVVFAGKLFSDLAGLF